MAIDDDIAVYFATQGYDPRSSRHSDFQSGLIIRDLIEGCPLIGQRAATGELVAKLRHHQQVGHDDWVIDIAMGSCSGVPVPPPAGQLIAFAPPILIQIAIELKGIVTEHGKARKNRLRDFNSFHGYAHRYDPRTVAAAFLVVNSAECFYSPLNLGKTKRPEINRHGRTLAAARQVAKNAIDLFRAIPLRHAETDGAGLEALGVVAIEHDNLAFHPDPIKYAVQHRPTQVSPSPPRLPPGDPLHYQAMVQRICRHYTQRFR